MIKLIELDLIVLLFFAIVGLLAYNRLAGKRQKDLDFFKFRTEYLMKKGIAPK